MLILWLFDVVCSPVAGAKPEDKEHLAQPRPLPTKAQAQPRQAAEAKEVLEKVWA